MSEWGFPKAVAKALGNEGFCSKVALLGLTDEDIHSFELKKGEMAALRTVVGQLQATHPQNRHTCTVPTSICASAQPAENER